MWCNGGIKNRRDISFFLVFLWVILQTLTTKITPKIPHFQPKKPSIQTHNPPTLLFHSQITSKNLPNTKFSTKLSTISKNPSKTTQCNHFQKPTQFPPHQTQIPHFAQTKSYINQSTTQTIVPIPNNPIPNPFILAFRSKNP